MAVPRMPRGRGAPAKPESKPLPPPEQPAGRAAMTFLWYGISANWSSVDGGVNNKIDLLVMLSYLLLVLAVAMWVRQGPGVPRGQGGAWTPG